MLHLHFDYLMNASGTTQQGQDHDHMIQAIERQDGDKAEDAAHGTPCSFATAS